MASRRKTVATKTCIVCFAEFKTRGSAKTCGVECSRTNDLSRARAYALRYRVSGPAKRTGPRVHRRSRLRFQSASEWHEAERAKRLKKGRDYLRRRLIAKYGGNLSALDAERCQICERHKDDVGQLHIDHSHATGMFRGMLCVHCNTMLGSARDMPEVLRRAADYLGDSNWLPMTWV